MLPTMVITEIEPTVCKEIGKEEAQACYQTLPISDLQIINLISAIAK
jgi:hypothetical protein